MSSTILASIAIPLMIVAATFIVDRMDAKAVNEISDDHERNDQKKHKDPPNDLIDLSGGTFGI